MKYLTFRTKYKESLLWFQDRKIFLNLDSKAKIIRKEIDRFNYIKIRNCFLTKDTIKKLLRGEPQARKK